MASTVRTASKTSFAMTRIVIARLRARELRRGESHQLYALLAIGLALFYASVFLPNVRLNPGQ
jgi:hypothetical protein